MNTTYDCAMRRQVMSLPQLLDEQYADLEPKVRNVLSFQEIHSCQRIILTGCGDSWAAAMAMKPAFEGLTGLKTEAIPALELSRYTPEKLLKGSAYSPLVIVVSNSGGAARLAEAVLRCNKYGAFTLAVTGKPESPLGIHAKRILPMEIPRFESAPGTRSYMVALLALLLLAIRIGEVRARYTMEEASARRRELKGLGQKLAQGLPQMDAAVMQIALDWSGLAAFDYVGAGADYATAWYGHAKMLEATGRHAMHINSEEWFHLNCFIKEPDQIGTVVAAHTANAGLSRTREMLAAAARMGRRLMVVTDGTAGDLGIDAACVQVPKTDSPYAAPLMMFVPLCLLAADLMAIWEEKQCRGQEGPWEFCKGAAGLKNSEIIVV
ncbi:MAG: SIS domain-containing protein [Lachnospiraceae bacterium]|nr:SIS domain-containing protein [Lachnospiraceae bacterium]